MTTTNQQLPETHSNNPAISSSFGTAESGAALGLVYSSTSHTPSVPIIINPKDSRVKKMRSGVITAARLHTEQATALGNRFNAVMITLTYRPQVNWNPDHISHFQTLLRNWCGRRGVVFRYVWVLELQASGKPHYHVLVWLPSRFSIPKPDKKGWWPYGMTRIEKAEHAIGYMAKYASKATGATKFPQGARIHGTGGLTAAHRNERAWWLSPAWVRDRWPDPAYKPRRFEGGGWWSSETGEWEPSPWQVVFRNGKIEISPKIN